MPNEDGDSKQNTQNPKSETPSPPPNTSIYSKKKRSNVTLLTLIFGLLFAGVGSYIVWNTFAAPNNDRPHVAHEHDVPEPFVDKPERGLIWAGLKAPQADSVCGHLFEVTSSRAKVPLCTHGPDPAPEGVDIRAGTAQDAATTGSTAATDPPPAIPCDGDGVSGNRVQALYVRAEDVPSQLSTSAEELQTYAKRTNYQYAESAKQTGSVRNIRWVHDAGCKPVIPEVVIPPAGDDTFGGTIDALKNLGHNRTDRKYMILGEAAVYCGIASIYADDGPESDNINNGVYPMYGRVDRGCWNYAEAHELMHNLGGVQMTAPNTSKGWHCTDEADEMCYSDNSGVVMVNTCPYTNNQSMLFDCNHDDYYYAGTPPAGNYLASHWNTANSSFLTGGGSPPPPPTQCNNSQDDDGDGKIDYPADPGCSATNDASESPDPPPPPPPDDTVAPTVSITQPANNASVRRSVGIYATGKDNVRVTRTELYIDGTLKTTSNGYQINYSWNLRKVTRASHTITVKAYDVKENVGQQSITVTVTR